MVDRELVKRLSGLEERTRILEARIDEISSRFDGFRMNSINNQKEHDEKIKTLIQAAVALKRREDELREGMRRIESKLIKTASQSELKELEAYLQLLSPLKFVTKNELNRIIKEMKKNGNTRLDKRKEKTGSGSSNRAGSVNETVGDDRPANRRPTRKRKV